MTLFDPLQLPPEAVHEVALVVDQLKVDEEPLVIEIGEAVRVTVGAATVTVTVTDCVIVPPAPVQARVYVFEEVRLPVDSEPEVDLVPVQPFEAVHEVALVVDQLKVDEEPLVIEIGEAVRVTVGSGLTVTVTDFESEPPGPVQVKV